MNVIMHYPTDIVDIEELKNRVTTVHVEAVKNYLMCLNCPLEEKMKLVQSIQDNSASGQEN